MEKVSFLLGTSGSSGGTAGRASEQRTGSDSDPDSDRNKDVHLTLRDPSAVIQEKSCFVGQTAAVRHCGLGSGSESGSGSGSERTVPCSESYVGKDCG